MILTVHGCCGIIAIRSSHEMRIVQIIASVVICLRSVEKGVPVHEGAWRLPSLVDRWRGIAHHWMGVAGQSRAMLLEIHGRYGISHSAQISVSRHGGRSYFSESIAAAPLLWSVA